ncbi:MAG: glycosyltransferase [Candidatus Omnitrophota bacterium]
MFDKVLELIRKNTSISIKFNLPSNDIYKHFYSHIDILVIPSSSQEIEPMTLFEALSYGIPVIVSDIDSITEKIKPEVNALVFKNKNVSSLEKSLKRAVSFPFDVTDKKKWCSSIKNMPGKWVFSIKIQF